MGFLGTQRITSVLAPSNFYRACDGIAIRDQPDSSPAARGETSHRQYRVHREIRVGAGWSGFPVRAPGHTDHGPLRKTLAERLWPALAKSFQIAILGRDCMGPLGGVRHHVHVVSHRK